MPKRKREYKSKPYRRRKRRRKNKTGTVAVLGRATPFPASYLCRHRYVETFTLDPGISTPDTELYSANGLYDPTVAAGGHQPIGFDQLTPLYDHYTVLGAKATIRFFSAGESLGQGSNMVYCYVNDDSTSVLTYDTVMEQSKGKVAALTGQNAKGSVTITQYFSAKKFFGVSDVKDNSQLKGSASSNPSDQAFFIIGAQGVSAGTDPVTIYCNITIDYITLWSERRDIAQS